MKRYTLFFIIFMLLIVLGGVWILQSAVPTWRREFAEWASEKATEALDTPVTIESISLTRWAGVEVRGVTIMDPLGGDEAFFSSPRIEVRFKPLKMIEGSIEFRLIAIDSPEIRIVKQEKWNLKSFGKPREKTREKREPFRMSIDRLVLRDSWTRVTGLTGEPFETRMDFNGGLEIGEGGVLIKMDRSSLNTTFVSFGEFLFEGDLTIQGKKLILDGFRLLKDETDVGGNGYILFEGPPTCHFDIDSPHFDFAHIPPGVGTRPHLRGSAGIEAVLDGKLLHPDVSASVERCSGDFIGYRFNNLSSDDVSYSDRHLEVNGLSTDFCNGALRGDFIFDFDTSPSSYSAVVTFDDFDVVELPHPVPGGLSGGVNGALVFRGEGFNRRDFSAESVVSFYEGTVGNVGFSALDATCELDGRGLTIVDSDISFPRGAAACSGTIFTGGMALDIIGRRVDIEQFPSLLPDEDLSGYLDFEGWIQGDYDRFDIEGNYVLHSLSERDRLKAAVVEGSCRVADFAGVPEGEVSVDARDIDLAGLGLESVETDIRITGDDYVMRNVFVRIDSTKFLEFSLDLESAGNSTVLSLSDLTIFHAGNASSSPGAVVLRKEPDRWVLEESELQFAGGRLLGHGVLKDDRTVDLEVSADSIGFYRTSQFFQVGRQLEGRFSSSVRMNGTLDEPIMSMTLQADDVYLEDTHVDSVSLEASYASRMLFIDEVALWKGDHRSRGTLNLPVDLALAGRADRLDHDGELFGELIVDIPLTFVNLLDSDLRASGGTIAASVWIGGTAGEPVWNGASEIRSGSGLFIPTNTYFDGIHAVFHMGEDTLFVDSFEASSMGGAVQSSGYVGFSGLSPGGMRFEIHLRDYGVHQIKHVAELSLDGDLVLERRRDRGMILRGIVELNDGEFSIAFGRQEDLNGRGQIITFPIELDVILQSGENVWFRNNQANVQMDIDLTLKGGQNGVRVSGEMITERGFYLFNGRKFEIEEGSVDFVGAAELNPILDVNASRIVRGRSREGEPIQNTIDLHIGGFYDEVQFEVDIYDETGTRMPVSREEAFALLILDLTKEEYDARSGSFYSDRLGNQVANLMTQQAASLLQDATPLDLITIDANLLSAESGTESAQISVGKYLTKRVFLTYSQDVINPSINNISVEYALRKRMFLIGQTNSTGTRTDYSVDFKYRFKY